LCLLIKLIVLRDEVAHLFEDLIHLVCLRSFSVLFFVK